MNAQRVKGFIIEIDGEKIAVEDNLESAKQKARPFANEGSSIKITSVGTGSVPSSAWYWDYEISNWVFSQNAVFAKAQRKRKEDI